MCYYTIPDIDECLTDNGGCPETCENTDGSYRCSCWEGYKLDNDNYTCIGRISYCITTKSCI